MVREILELGNPVLRQIAASLTEWSSPEFRSFVQDLKDTLEAIKGLGLCGPQIGVSQRIFFARYPVSPDVQTGYTLQPTVFANPVLEWASKETAKDSESCLSIPGIRGLVPRPTSIRIKYVDGSTAAVVTKEYNGFIARILQHEYDHLDGIVYLDRMETNRDLITEKEYQKMKATKAV
jgi:peptide deformylase